jgi:hypothetical protein
MGRAQSGTCLSSPPIVDKFQIIILLSPLNVNLFVSISQSLLGPRRRSVYRALTLAVLKARMLLQVHDELLFEVPEAEADDTATGVKAVTEGACESHFFRHPDKRQRTTDPQ